MYLILNMVLFIRVGSLTISFKQHFLLQRFSKRMKKFYGELVAMLLFGTMVASLKPN